MRIPLSAKPARGSLPSQASGWQSEATRLGCPEAGVFEEICRSRRGTADVTPDR
jgi:hypothetical protein